MWVENAIYKAISLSVHPPPCTPRGWVLNRHHSHAEICLICSLAGLQKQSQFYLKIVLCCCETDKIYIGWFQFLSLCLLFCAVSVLSACFSSSSTHPVFSPSPPPISSSVFHTLLYLSPPSLSLPHVYCTCLSLPSLIHSLPLFSPFPASITSFLLNAMTTVDAAQTY